MNDRNLRQIDILNLTLPYCNYSKQAAKFLKKQDKATQIRIIHEFISQEELLKELDLTL